MPSSSDQDRNFQQREQELHEREMQLRLRELEVELEAQKKKVNDQAEEATTVIKDLDPEALAKQRKLRKIVLFSKLALLAIGVASLVVVLKLVLFPVMIFGTLGLILYGIYFFFVRESVPKTPSN